MKKQRISLNCTKGTLGSKSLKTLAQILSQRLGYKVFRTLKVFPKAHVVKYGQGVDKLTQYRWFEQKGIPSLEFTTEKEKVQEWIDADKVVFGRKFLNSSCGKGIVVLDQQNAWDGAIYCPVYTVYKKKKREFRVHIYKDTVVAVTEKRRRKDWEGQQDSKIRNLANGYVFCQEVENEPEGLRKLAVEAAQISPSFFRGVDIGYNEKEDQLFVIEVNSAPGIQGTNIEKYVGEILKSV